MRLYISQTHLLASLILTVAFLYTKNVNAQAWGEPKEIYYNATGGDVGEYTSLATINGKPAIAYYDVTNSSLVYMRAKDVSGLKWYAPITVDNDADVGWDLSLKDINGNPAISYRDVTNSNVKYVRANDTDGDNWGTPVIVESSGHSRYTSLLEVDNKPAICFWDGTYLKYTRANDSIGSTWAASIIADNNTGVGSYTSMVIVNGNPAISYQDDNNKDLKYVRASNVDGSSWGTPITIDAALNVGGFTSLVVIDGNPAISYWNRSNNTLKYVRASNADGSSWGMPITIDSMGSAFAGGGAFTSMTSINNNPAISYWQSNTKDLRYVRATNSTGSSWGTPVSIDVTGDVGESSSLALINGIPAITYYDRTNGNLKFVRALDISGSNWATTVSQDSRTDISIEYTSIVIANGNPAMSYCDVVNNDLVYMRATNSNGTAWGTPITVDTTGDVGQYADMIIVNDTPVIAYYDATNKDVKFVQANNKEGSSWGTPIAVQYNGSVGRYTRLAIVNSKPAIVYLDETNSLLEYVLADNISGTGWGAPVAIASYTSGFESDPSVSFKIVNGNPTVAYYKKNGGDLAYVRASSSDGSTWSSPVTVSSTNDVGIMPSLAVVNGNPAISFYDATNDDLLYIRATNANGTAWGTLGRLDSIGDVGSYPSLSVINDRPSVAYTDVTNGNLKYTLASDVDGSSWGSSIVLDDCNGTYSTVVTSGSNVHLCYYANKTPTYIRGESGTTWNGTTWSSGTPTSSTIAEIASNTTPGSFSCSSLVIQSGVALNTSTNNTVNIYGDVTNYGNGAIGTGELLFRKSGTVELLGDTLDYGGAIHVMSGCTLETNNRLRVTSSAGGTGRIASSAGTISGNVMVQRYIPGSKRAFRFFGHPFSHSVALSQLTDEIDITGSGGATNGFTTTGTNKPSAFWFDETAADTATSGANTGWTPFTSATSYDWDQYELLRLLVRGAKGEGLNGGSYTPSAATFEAIGEVNQGTQVVTLTKGANSDFVGCGNPFPDGVQMNAVSKGSNVGANYYVWDATSGTKGAYVTNAFSLSYVLPAWGAFFTTVTANSNNTITFEEVDKSSGGASLFKTTNAKGWVELYIYDSTTKWDRLLINLNDDGMVVDDKLDGKKLYNPDLDFFTLSKDKVRLAVDVRPYEDNKSILLGLTAYNRYNRYVIRAGMFDIPQGTKLILHDKYLNKQKELKSGLEYWFDVTTDSLSQGNGRFEINMVGTPTTSIASATNSSSEMQLIPNPAYSEVKVSFTKLEGKSRLIITSVTGRMVYQQEVNASEGSVTIPLSDVPSGMYIVELKGNNARFARKLIKH